VPAEAVRWGLTQGEMACPDCPLANIQPEMPSQGAGRILHHILWEHLMNDNGIYRPPLPVKVRTPFR
jgi:hypothetical protein